MALSGQRQSAVPEGKYTETVYGLIRDQKYDEAVAILSIELQSFPRSRAALSLLGHCYYMMQDYNNAVAMYEQLVKFYSEVEEYKIYYSQSLYKAGVYADATRAALRVESDAPKHVGPFEVRRGARELHSATIGRALLLERRRRVDWHGDGDGQRGGGDGGGAGRTAERESDGALRGDDRRFGICDRRRAAAERRFECCPPRVHA